MSKFINNFWAESEPLQQLLKRENDFSWSKDQLNSLNRLKDILTRTDTLQYFDHILSLVIQTDASTAEIGAGLMQDGRPIACSLRSLTTCEQNYVSLELECLAIMFGAERFDQHIFGHRDVTIHKTMNHLLVFSRSPSTKYLNTNEMRVPRKWSTD